MAPEIHKLRRRPLSPQTSFIGTLIRRCYPRHALTMGGAAVRGTLASASHILRKRRIGRDRPPLRSDARRRLPVAQSQHHHSGRDKNPILINCKPCESHGILGSTERRRAELLQVASGAPRACWSRFTTISIRTGCLDSVRPAVLLGNASYLTHWLYAEYLQGIPLQKPRFPGVLAECFFLLAENLQATLAVHRPLTGASECRLGRLWCR